MDFREVNSNKMDCLNETSSTIHLLLFNFRTLFQIVEHKCSQLSFTIPFVSNEMFLLFLNFAWSGRWAIQKLHTPNHLEKWWIAFEGGWNAI